MVVLLYTRSSYVVNKKNFCCVQDDIAPFSSEEAFEMIETDLQRPIKSLFSTISDAPVAAASLGQVYKAQLASDGSTVAVKVLSLPVFSFSLRVISRYLGRCKCVSVYVWRITHV